MVEPVSLAATAVALLAPYLKRLAERTADDVADAALPAVKRLYQAVKQKLRPGTGAGQQLERVEQQPGSEAGRQALHTALAVELARDPGFADELASLVREAEAAGAPSVLASDAGVVAGRDVRQEGTYVAGRDMTIGGPGPDRQ